MKFGRGLSEEKEKGRLRKSGRGRIHIKTGTAVEQLGDADQIWRWLVRLERGPGEEVHVRPRENAGMAP